MSEQFGEAVVTKHADGTIVVERADPIILVAKELLADPGLATYVDGVLTIDTAGKYRYRRIRSHDEHADVFHRITPDEQEAST
jgi:hypothetical protein